MTFRTVECTCKPNQEYADGTLPVYYENEFKAAFMFNKLSRKALEGFTRVQKELIIMPDGSTKNGLAPLPNLKDYNMYFGIHINGKHIMKILP